MDKLDFIFASEENSWLDTLPTYQKDIIADLLDSYSYENAAKEWVNASVDNTSPFSAGERTENQYFKSLKREFTKLLCGNPEYKNEQQELIKLINKPKNQTAIVSSISAALGAKLGLTVAFIAPVTTLLLMTVTKVTLNAWCAIQIEE